MTKIPPNLKLPKYSQKMTKIPLKPKNYQNTPGTQKMTKILLKPKK